MYKKQTYTNEDFERKGQELVSIMIELCEMRYTVSSGPYSPNIDAMAKNSVVLIDAIKAFAAVAKLSN